MTDTINKEEQFHIYALQRITSFIEDEKERSRKAYRSHLAEVGEYDHSAKESLQNTLESLHELMMAIILAREAWIQSKPIQKLEGRKWANDVEIKDLDGIIMIDTGNFKFRIYPHLDNHPMCACVSVEKRLY